MGAVEKLGSARAQVTGWADATVARSFLDTHLSPEVNLLKRICIPL
jgi:hypothetical protein